MNKVDEKIKSKKIQSYNGKANIKQKNNDIEKVDKIYCTIDNIDCANCATKIENAINKMAEINEANVNFIGKKVTLDIKGGLDITEVLAKVQKVADNVEQGVVIAPIRKDSNNKIIIYMENLTCAGCATKIEAQAEKIEGVTSSVLDFVSKKLILELGEDIDKKEVENKALDLIEEIEPGTKCEIQSNNKKVARDEKISIWKDNKKELIQLGVGVGIFAGASIFDFTPLISTILYLISYVIVGGEILLRAIKNIFRGKVFDENFLMAIATVGAFIIGEHAEGVAVMIFYQVGELFQSVAVNRSRNSITALMDIRPDYANIKIGEELKKVDPEEVKINDIIVVKPGEKVPLDGVVIEGKSMVDTSALTGESVPRSVEVGNEILGGCINKNGVLTVKVTKVFGESTVAKILDLVQNASSKKAPTENFISKFARYYTPVVVILATALAVLPPLFVSTITFSDSLYRALVFLVISCPCALVVSIPLGFFGGIGGAAKHGILVKGGNYLEALNNVEAVVFDKTGTLTKGVFKVTEVKASNNFSNDEVMAYAADAESFSNHPIATSIVEAFGKAIDSSKLSEYEEISGHGISVVSDGKTILAGNYKLMDKDNIKYDVVETIGTIVHVAVDKVYAGYIVISDEVKEDSAQAIKELKKAGVKKTVMLTGDNKNVGEKVGKILNLDEVYAELLPDNKVEKLEQLEAAKSKNGKIVFVGDGINDAPVLARADIGIAMGGVGSDAAIEAADVIIMTDEPSKIASAIKIAKKTRKIVVQNIVFALGVKLIILALGAFGIATMWEAVFADVGVSLIAVLNAMRALNVDKK